MSHGQAVPLSIHGLQAITLAHICWFAAAFGWNRCTRSQSPFGTAEYASVEAELIPPVPAPASNNRDQLEARGSASEPANGVLIPVT